jgi:two-component system response regulator RpaA
MMTREFRPNIILLDYMLPDVNGNIVCERIKSDPDLADTRIIIISGVVQQEEIDGLLEAGADAFIRKPFQVEELIQKINELILA